MIVTKMINAVTVIWSGRGLNTGTSNFALDIHLLGLLSSTLVCSLSFLVASWLYSRVFKLPKLIFG